MSNNLFVGLAIFASMVTICVISAVMLAIQERRSQAMHAEKQ